MWTSCALYTQFSLDLPVWRYLPWYKFEDLVNTSSLFFTRADLLKKKFDDAEGAMTASERELIDFTLEGMHDYIASQSTPVLKVSGIPFQGARSIDLAAYTENVAKTYAYYLNNMYVNCWHQNCNEDVSMWREYVPDGNGVAIHASTRTLLKSLEATPEEVFGSTVEYIDHAREPVGDALRRGGGLYLVLLQMLIRKKIRFAGERELRLLTCPLPARELYGPLLRKDLPSEKRNADIGRRLKIHLSELTPRVVLHPNASTELYDRVVTLLNSVGNCIGLGESKISHSAIPKGAF